MKHTKILFAALAVIVLCCALVLAACVEVPQNNGDTPAFSITVNDFAYTGDAAVPQISAGDLEYELAWYSISEAGELTKLTEAPSTPGYYKVVATLKNVEGFEAFANFTINKAQTTVNIEDISKIYDGDIVEAKYTTNSDSQNISVKYRQVSPNASLWTDEAPSAVGEYEVRVIVGESFNYADADVTASFSIVNPTVLAVITGYSEVELLVSNTNKVLTIHAATEEGNLLKNLLTKQEAIGKSITDVATLAASILYEEGCLYNNQTVEIYAEDESVGNAVKESIKAKLQAVNVTSNVTLGAITAQQIRDITYSSCLEYTDEDLNAMSIAEVKALLYKSRKITASYENNDVLDLFEVLRAKAIIEAKLEALKIKLGESDPNYANVVDALSDVTLTFDSLMPRYESDYLSPTGNSYPNTVVGFSRHKLMDAIKANDTLAIEKYTNIVNYETYDTEPYKQSYMKDMYEVLEYSKEEVLKGQDVTVDVNAIEEAFIASFNEKYSKYLQINYWTFENIFVEGDILHFYQSEKENKTYAIMSFDHPDYDSLYGFTYEFDGIIAQDAIKTVKPTKVSFASEITDYDNNLIEGVIITMGEEINFLYSFFETNGSYEMQYIDGEINQVVVIPNLMGEGGPTTIAFVTKDNATKAYFYFDSLTAADLANRPCSDIADCVIDETNKKVYLSNTKFCPLIAFDIDNEGNYTYIEAKGDFAYGATVSVPGSENFLVFKFTVDGTDNLLYVSQAKTAVDPEYGLFIATYVGEWDESDTKVWAYLGDVTYVFVKQGSQLTLDKVVSGD